MLNKKQAMNEPKRYSVTESYGLGDMREETQGEYVRYDDYVIIKHEVEWFKDRLRDQINLLAAAHISAKMYQDNVDSGGLHKDRKEIIKRLEAENMQLKKEIEKLTKEKDNFIEVTYIKGIAGIDKGESTEGTKILNELKEKQGDLS